jgi:hypothetical protein
MSATQNWTRPTGFAPQGGAKDMVRLIGAYEDIVLRGRKPGMGSTSITHRSAQLHSAIRSQVEVLVAMRLLGKLDVAAIDELIRLHATEENARELKASLPSLPVGTAWVWSPGWLELLTPGASPGAAQLQLVGHAKVGQQVITAREVARADPGDLARMAVLLQPGSPAEPAGVVNDRARNRRGDVLQRTLHVACDT